METRVADLIAAGRSNKEVAAEVYLSPKTIEAHLSSIYRKLGLRSRTELAAHLLALREPKP
jgi:DNA-binding NarL/FixJ family response regulator